MRQHIRGNRSRVFLSVKYWCTPEPRLPVKTHCCSSDVVSCGSYEPYALGHAVSLRGRSSCAARVSNRIVIFFFTNYEQLTLTVKVCSNCANNLQQILKPIITSLSKLTNSFCFDILSQFTISRIVLNIDRPRASTGFASKL